MNIFVTFVYATYSSPNQPRRRLICLVDDALIAARQFAGRVKPAVRAPDKAIQCSLMWLHFWA